MHWNILLLCGAISLLAYYRFALFAALSCLAFFGALLFLEIFMCRRPGYNPFASDADKFIPLMIVVCIVGAATCPMGVFRYFSV
jgi:hypothetical protein